MVGNLLTNTLQMTMHNLFTFALKYFWYYRFKSTTRQGDGISSTDKEAWYYNMHHKNRGKAIIFNHENFEIRDLKPRAGTGLDCFNLESSLKKLGFDVTPYVDLTLDQLEKKLDHCMYYVYYVCLNE